MAARQRALNFVPGTDYSYTKTGFNISTILIERALGNGKTFQMFTREMIFEPLNMLHSSWRDNFRTVLPNRALAYERSTGEVWTQDTPVENIIGAGGLLTTVGDLLLWNESFTHARVGGQELVRAQQTTATLRGGRKITDAVGLSVSTFDGLPEVSHSGVTGGYRTWLARYPDQGVSVAVLCNAGQANPVVLGRNTVRIWTGGSPTRPPQPTRRSRRSAVVRRHVPKDSRQHRLRGALAEWQLTVDSATELAPISAGKFLGAASEREFDFEEGSPIRLRVVTPTGDILYERVEPAQPTVGELAALTGEYESHETGTTLTLALDARHDLSHRLGTINRLSCDPHSATPSPRHPAPPSASCAIRTAR